MNIKVSKVVLCVASALSLSASCLAMPVNITMSGGVSVIAAPAGDLPGFGDGDVLAWLKNDVVAYNAAHATSYGVPIGNLDGTPLLKSNTDGPGSITFTLGTYDYLFLHWGGQRGGSAQGYYIGGLTGQAEFFAPPGGPPAVGGLSFYSFYNSTPPTTARVPDAGGTLTLLGMGCACLLGAVRKLKRG